MGVDFAAPSAEQLVRQAEMMGASMQAVLTHGVQCCVSGALGAPAVGVQELSLISTGLGSEAIRLDCCGKSAGLLACHVLSPKEGVVAQLVGVESTFRRCMHD